MTTLALFAACLFVSFASAEDSLPADWDESEIYSSADTGVLSDRGLKLDYRLGYTSLGSTHYGLELKVRWKAPTQKAHQIVKLEANGVAAPHGTVRFKEGLLSLESLAFIDEEYKKTKPVTYCWKLKTDTSGFVPVEPCKVDEKVAPKVTPSTSSEVTPWEEKRQAYFKGLPQDVIGFLERTDSCQHFADEEPYNEKRRQEISAAVSKLKCDLLDTEKKQILQKYKKQLTIVEKIKNFPDALE